MLRGKWISEEDMDNNYYHLKNIVRRRRKKIKALRNENRDWECDAEKLKEIVMRHFYDIFKEDQENREPIVTFFLSYPTYLEDRQIHLRTISSSLEIHKALFLYESS